MTALYIAAGILLLLAALLLVRVQVGVSYIGDLRVELRLGPLRLDLTPEPAEPAAPEAEAPSGAAHKKEKKEKGEGERESLLRARGAAYRAGHGREAAAPDAPLALLRPVRTQGQRRLRGPRPNRRAVRTHQRAGGGAHPRHTCAASFQAPRDVFCEVTPDFLSESFDFMIDAAFGLRVWQGAALGITALRGFLKIRKSGKKEDDANEQRASTQADH